MPWTPWITIAPLDSDDPAVAGLYHRTRALSGRPPDTVRLTSRIPEVAGLLHDLNRAVHDSATGLSAREQEIAALIVSSLNG